MSVAAKVYITSSVLLPNELIINDSKVTALLFDYMEDLCYPPDMKSLEVYKQNIILKKDGSRITSRDEVRFPIPAEKLQVLTNENIPIYYDVLLMNKKIFAYGPYLPGLTSIIGEAKLFLINKNNNNRIQVNAFQQCLIPPQKVKVKEVYAKAINYLIIEDVPQDALQNLHDWELSFEFNDFAKKVKINDSAFAGAKNDLTLVTMQKNQSLEQLSAWCNHYILTHGVQRVVIYNNGMLAESNLKQLSLKHQVELIFVEWNYTFQLRFTSCHASAITHANWLFKDSTSYILNFDPDEFLVNESKLPLLKYLQDEAPLGIRITGYEVPPSINLDDKHDNSVREKSIQQPRSDTKYIFSTGTWHNLNEHSARRYTFIVKPAYWTMLEYSSKSPSFLIAKYLYKLFFWPARLFAFLLKMKQPDEKEIYYLHYRSANSQWKWSKEFLNSLENQRA